MAGIVPEGLNPTRRYRWFRPRQAAWVSGTATAVSNFANQLLFNDSPNQLLLVRAITLNPQGNDTIKAALIRGLITTVLIMHGQPIMPDQGQPPGTLFQQDAAAPTTTPAWTLIAASNQIQPIAPIFPIFVIPPVWSLQIWNASAHNQFTSSILYEYIFPEQLDFFD